MADGSPIVVLGASAGGLDALTQVVSRLNAPLGAAVIIVTHLSPDHRSLMPELLARQTRLPVHAVIDQQAIEVDTIVLNTPGTQMTVEQDRIRTAPIPPGHLSLPIDRMLGSLAGAYGQRVIAVILSGTGSDGARGCQAVKEAGGTVLVQSPTDAQFDGMPRSAIAIGAPDVIAPSAELAAQIVAEIDRRRDGVVQPRPSVDLDAIDALIAWLGQASGTDFTEYKRSTVIRRIERRMALTGAADVPEFQARLQAAPAEVELLVRDLLISVTSFFRDAEAFRRLQTEVVAPLLERHREGTPIRVWVPACATGEEAYSLAILFAEAAAERQQPLNLKIFATDIDRAATEFASAASYPDSIADELGEERLQRWFVRKGERWLISKQIRDLVVVATHNLLRDPPFFRIDLISCRNLFIYLETRTQRRLLNAFHFALVPGGFLFMGAAESLGEAEAGFEPVDARWKIFRSRPGASGRLSDAMGDLHAIGRGRAGAPPARTPAHDQVMDALLGHFVPPAIVLDENLDVLHLVGEVGKYLNLPSGRATLHLPKIAPRELALALATGVRQALKGAVPIQLGRIALPAGEVEIELRPFLDVRQAGAFVAAILRTPTQPSAAPPITIPIEAGERIDMLERELERAKINLQGAVEEAENANEELQATNEELLAANEELQSTNEELQSVNEELYTVNGEYQAKIAELIELNDDMANFLKGTTIGAVFVDANLCVRKFTPAVTRQINLIERDIGRPLTHISHNLVDVDLMTLARGVVETFVACEREVATAAGGWYQMRILPYRTEGKVVAGVVVTFVDITEVRRAADRHRRLSIIVERIDRAVLMTDAQAQITYINQAFTELTGYGLGELAGRNPRVLQAGTHPPEFWAQFWKVLAAGGTWRGRMHNRTRAGQLAWMQAEVYPIGSVQAPDGYVMVTQRAAD